MTEYHKIQTVFKRDPSNNFKTLLEGEYSLPEFEYLKNNEWDFTEKVDGTNIRVIWNGRFPTFAGKTDRADIPPFLLSALAELFDCVSMHSVLGEEEYCLYGEGYGPKIQSGGKYRDTHSFVLFDVRCGDLWLQRSDVMDIGDKLDIPVVPIIGTGTLGNIVNLAKEGFSSLWGPFQAEGIVARPKAELLTRRGERVITKIKCRDFPRQ